MNTSKGKLYDRRRSSQSAMEFGRQDILEELKRNCIISGSKERIISRYGKPLEWLVDTRIALLNPTKSETIGRLMWAIIREMMPAQITCLEITGIPLLLAVQHAAFKDGVFVNGTIIRKEQKSHGRQRWIEGELNDEPIVLLDDIVHSGRSLEAAQSALSTKYRTVDQVVALIDYESVLRDRPGMNSHPPLSSVFKLSELGLSASTKSFSRPPNQLKIAWSYDGAALIPAQKVPLADPVVDENMVFFCGGGRCVALDQVSGAVLWEDESRVAHYKGIRSTPAVSGERIVVCDYDGRCRCLRKSTGEEMWTFHEADWIGSSPCLLSSSGQVVVGLEHASDRFRGSLISLSMLTGDAQWRVDVPDYIHCSPLHLGDNKCIVIGTNGGLVLCLDAHSGSERWTHSGEGGMRARAASDPSRNQIVIGSHAGYIIAIDVNSGVLKWRAKAAGPIYSEPLIVGDFAYVSCLDKSVYVIDLYTGSFKSKLMLEAKVFGSPILLNHNIVFGTTAGRLYQFDQQTEILTELIDLKDGITTRVGYSKRSGLMFVSTTNDSLYALREVEIEVNLAGTTD
jgi:outer membrane protein assembly factor BamB/orotate phosphoribosyltransferase